MYTKINLEIKTALEALGSDARNQAIYQLIADWDADGHGIITFEDFTHLMTNRVT